MWGTAALGCPPRAARFLLAEPKGCPTLVAFFATEPTLSLPKGGDFDEKISKQQRGLKSP
jgi:hypothetical protein